MAIYFVSSADGDNGDSGATLDLAWATLEYALESGGLSAGDTVMIRRTHSEIPTSNIAPNYNGTPASPIIIAGCPRDAHAISSSDWTNGSVSVNVDDNDMDREQHQGRYITAPDGETYLITRVTDSATIVLDREYAGSTSSNDATASIQADDIVADWESYDDSGDTIKKSNWEADADDLPVIDFNDGDYQLILNANDDNLEFHNMEVKDSTDSSGIINIYNGPSNFLLKGCLLKQSTQNDLLLGLQYGASVNVERCIFEGSGSGGDQRGIRGQYGAMISLKDCAIYNCGGNGIYLHGSVLFLENVNIGTEIANANDDIYCLYSKIYGRDVRLGGSNGYVDFDSTGNGYHLMRCSFENFQKVLGNHRTYYPGGYFERSAVSGETPNKKVSDYVMKIVPNVNCTPNEEGAFIMLRHEIELTADTHTLRYWIYNDTGDTLNDTTAKDDIWLKAEYIKEYDDTSEYVIAEEFSDEIDIADAADADDYDYLEVTITTATAGKVRLTIYLSYYSAAGNIFIDPAVQIS